MASPNEPDPVVRTVQRAEDAVNAVTGIAEDVPHAHCCKR
jgi:hypothetical protein